jgi:uncharacterized protein (TIGR03118 family)
VLVTIAQDPNLKNPWGLAAGAQSRIFPSTPWWVADNQVGKVTIYDGDGNKQNFVVNVVDRQGMPGAPTGMIVYGGIPGAFPVGAMGAGARFITAQENGLISAWANQAANPTNTFANVVDMDPATTVFKGLDVNYGSVQDTRIYAANFRAGTVNAWDINWLPVLYQPRMGSLFTGTMTGANAVPPVVTPATGTFSIAFDTAAHTMSIVMQWSALTGATTVAHIHCCTAVPGTGTAPHVSQNNFPGFPVGVMAGSYSVVLNTLDPATYDAAFLAAHGNSPALAEAFLFSGMVAGTAYVNIHTTTATAGEINDFTHAATIPGTQTPLPPAWVIPGQIAGYAPFNVKVLPALGGVVVTYAFQDNAKMDSVAAPGAGYVALFTFQGQFVTIIAAGGVINAPWGVEWVPSCLGCAPSANWESATLLVGNFGDGRINAFRRQSGAGVTGPWFFVGQAIDVAGNVIVIPGLWGIALGKGGNSGPPTHLYYTAGGADEQSGVFGFLTGPRFVA